MRRQSNSILPIALLVVLVAAAGFVLLVKPKQAELADRREELNQATTELAATKAALASFRASKDDPELAGLLVKIPRTEDSPALLNQVNAAATAAGVTVDHLNVGVPAVSTIGEGSQLAVSIAATGTRAGVDTFLTNLAALPRLTIIEQANVNPSASADEVIDPGLAQTFEVQVDLAMFSGTQSATQS